MGDRLNENPVDLQKLPELICDEFSEFAGSFTEMFGASLRRGELTNVWRAAGIGRDELRNCEVLKWILDKFGDHGQGSAILERLLNLVGGPVTAELVEGVKLLRLVLNPSRWVIAKVGLISKSKAPSS